MNKVTVFGLALILMFLLLTACGVPQEDYIKVSSDLGAAQAQIQALQGEVTIAKTQIQSLQGDLSTKESELSAKESELTAAQTQIQSLQGDLSTKDTELSAKNSELEATKEKLEQGKARIEILNAIFIPAMTGELDRMTEAESVAYFLEWRDKVIAVGDPTLTAKFQAIIDTLSDEASLSFFLYLLESIAKALGYTYVSSSST